MTFLSQPSYHRLAWWLLLISILLSFFYPGQNRRRYRLKLQLSLHIGIILSQMHMYILSSKLVVYLLFDVHENVNN